MASKLILITILSKQFALFNKTCYLIIFLLMSAKQKCFKNPDFNQGWPFSNTEFYGTGSIFRIRFDHRTKLRMLNLANYFNGCITTCACDANTRCA